MRQTIVARALHTPSGLLQNPVLEIEDGILLEIRSDEDRGGTDILTPAFFDIHVHGAMSYDFMSAAPAGIDAIGRFLASRGVAHYLATTVSSGIDATLASLDRLATYMGRDQHPAAAAMTGLHLEGPFLCPAKRGVHPLDRIQAPGIELFSRFQEAAQGTIRLITLAPEMPGASELIEYCTARGVRVSMGHSNATAVETQEGIRAGATSATHTFNAMRAMDHREPGIAGTVLDTHTLFAELIADGIHVHPAMVRLWLKAKGEERAILVTDGMAATGMPNGTYHLGDLVVDVQDGVCLSGGVLAGSVLTMDRAVDNLREMTGASLSTAVRLASANPAAMLGLEAVCEVKPGSPATFNVYNGEGRRLGLWLHGKRLPA